MSQSQYTKEWAEATVIPIGGSWAYCVGRLENGDVRIAKGQIDRGKEGTGCPISQVQKLNVKTKDKALWEQIKTEVDRLLSE